MKLSPKGAKFCPGCPKKDLSLKKAPQLIITEEKKESAKVVTILSKSPKKSSGEGLF